MQEEIKENKLEVMPIPKLLFNMSLPAMFSMLIQACYNIIDSIFVSMIGEDALTAVSLVFPIQLLIISVAVGTGVGLSSLISRRLGQKRQEEANSAASHGIFLAICSWLVFAAFGFLFSRVFIGSFTEDPYLYSAGVQYCSIVTIFSLFCFMQIFCEKIMQATGNMIFPMICSLTGAITNIILDPIMIFGLFGCPKMGVAGAAIATVIGQAVGMVVTLIFLFGKKHQVEIHLRGFRLSFTSIKDIYSVGFPSIAMQSIGSVMNLGMNAILISFSGAAVAVFGIYFKLQSFIFMPVFGLNQGTMPILGFNFGARNKKRLMETFRLALIVAMIVMGIGTLLFQVFPSQLMMMFNASDEMMDIGIRALRNISLCFIPAAIGIVCATLFQATGHGFLSLVVSVLRQLVIILPLAWALAHFFGIDTLWYAFPLAEVFSLTASIFFYHKIYKEQIEPLDPPKET